jgi:UDP-N-acetylmuramoylalanine-D-glutamate ligase
MKGQTVVVMGLGASGRAAARLAVARGAKVIGVDMNEKTVPLEVELLPSLYVKQTDTRIIIIIVNMLMPVC